ncbi:MAG: isoleucyl-tRNA synthetase, partial [Patescibacteria group bacterium]|nr:isoleucyl-tRNA synthetase [Patescibacteria group bacterium]
MTYSHSHMDDKKQGGEELHHVAEKPKSALAAREEETLAFWNREKIFEKSLEKKAPKGEYVFYDGPPFATGLPHYGHLLQSALKDAIPRYRTMQGYHVARQWGWDCHGLPLENQIEQELGFKSKRDIEEYGIQRFNEAARAAVLRYADDWRRIIPRIGRWVDMEHDYKTMDSSYTESVWWAFKNMYDRELIYEGFKAMHYCPRCGTTLSNNEVALGYQDIEDVAVFVKLPLVDEPGTALLIWTTTPWTLPGNVAAAVNKEAAYVKVKVGEEFLVVAKELAPKVFGENVEMHGEVLGAHLVGMSYEPPFNYFREELHKHKTHAWKVYAAPYVTLTDGTGIVHLAPAYGAEDLELAQKEKIPLIHHVGEDGKFIPAVTDFGGLPVKPKGRHKETDLKIVEHLQQSGRLFKHEIITHSYPHCWRCDTPLLNWAANSWFVDVQKVKQDLVDENAKVHWVPEHVGRGRFHNGLQSAPDWAISRSRYWGAPIPVWRNSKTKEVRALGSVDELLSQVRRSGNRYFVMRHGEARSNVEGFVNSSNDIENHLTEQGKEMVRNTAKEFANQGITMIVASPITRAQETAKLMAKELGLASSAIMTDTRLAEVHFGEKNGAPLAEWQAVFATFSDKFNLAVGGGETYAQVLARVGDFLFDIERRYSGKNVLIVTH